MLTDELLHAPESAAVERKTSLADTRKIIETIAGMATNGGGAIVVGIRDNGEVVGANVGKGEIERLVQQVLAATDPRLYVDITRESMNGKQVLLIRVPPGDGPHLAFGRAFYRSGSTTVAMTRDEYERRLLDRLRESSGYERRVEPSLRHADIDEGQVRRFLQLARTRAPTVSPTSSPRDLLQRLHLLADDAITVGAVLLFGAEPQAAFPQAVISARALRGVREDTLRIEGTLMSQIDAAVQFVARNLRTKVERKGVRRDERTELPIEAVREVVANAVAHRDYRSTAPTQLVLEEERLDIWNPGHLPPPLTASALRTTHPSVPPNPLIARALYLAGYIEEWGTGTTRVIELLRANGNPEPMYLADDAGFRAVLPITHPGVDVLSERQRQALRRIKAGRAFSSTNYAEWMKVSLRTAGGDLAHLEALGLVRRTGRGKATRWLRL